MNKLFVAAIVAVWLGLSSLGGFSAVYGQDAPTATATPTTEPVVVTGDATVVTTTPQGDDTTVINTPAGQPTTIEQGDTTVVVPVGDWVDKVLAWVQTALAAIVAAVVAWAFRNLPQSVTSILRTLQIEQVLTRAADYGINLTRGAVKGKALEVDVHNEAVAKALQYALDNAPRWLINWAGGPEALRDKLMARIPASETVGS